MKATSWFLLLLLTKTGSCLTVPLVGGGSSRSFLMGRSLGRVVAPRTASTASRTTSLSMHMGHSHSHSHAGHEQTSTTSSQPSRRMKRRRFAGLFLFCALAILGPPLVRKHTLAKSDIAAFSLTSLSLFAMEPVRHQVQYMIRRMRQLGDGILRHSTPISPAYFFKNDSAADRVTLLGGVVNILLSAGKFFVGITCHSSALIADAGHSLSDLFSDFVTLWAVQVGRLPPDEDHPYGHGKFEAIGSLFLSLTLFGTGIGVGAMSNKRLLEILALQKNAEAAVTAAVLIPKFPALIMAGLSVISKEWLFRITEAVGKQLNSQIVIANAWHHRSDAYSSILALISIGLAMAVPSFVAADAAAGMFVAGMICVTGAEIMGESIKQLTDHTSNEELVKKVTELAKCSDDVENVIRVRARQVGSASAVDVSVAMTDDRTASAARAVEERIKKKIMKEDGVVDVEVRATSPPGVICPLLLDATNDAAAPVSEAQVESCVRDEIREQHPEVKSVEGVTIHYENTLLINVDVDIRIDDMTTIAGAGLVADGLRKTLENSSQINTANIFLDLNNGVRTPV